PTLGAGYGPRLRDPEAWSESRPACVTFPYACVNDSVACLIERFGKYLTRNESFIGTSVAPGTPLVILSPRLPGIGLAATPANTDGTHEVVAVRAKILLSTLMVLGLLLSA